MSTVRRLYSDPAAGVGRRPSRITSFVTQFASQIVKKPFLNVTNDSKLRTLAVESCILITSKKTISCTSISDIIYCIACGSYK